MVGEKITGFTVAQTISKDGVRQSASRAYLWPRRNRKNLHIALNATVTKVNTKKVGPTTRATGINLVMVREFYVFIKLYISTRDNFSVFRMASRIQ